VIERVVTSGIFALDGGEWEVDNNIWIVGNDEEVLILDAAHDHQPIVDAVRGRRVVAVVATHGHNDHINAADELAKAVDAPILLHPADLELWHQVYAREPDGALADGDGLTAGGVTLRVLHTPGHSPGGCCLYDAVAGVVFTGDTLFNGGPGATGRSFSDYPTIVASIRDRLLTLPGDTVVNTGHGDSTTIGAEAPQLPEWLAKI
jgi:glyoxylase-like metal-dependent hydrolase (beta-lactamase superfamily II)